MKPHENWPEDAEMLGPLLGILAERIRTRPPEQITEWDAFTALALVMQQRLMGIEMMIGQLALNVTNLQQAIYNDSATLDRQLDRLNRTMESIHGLLTVQKNPW